jgi:hypothetical protein
VTAVLQQTDSAHPAGDDTTPESAPRPLAYGYMRVPCDIPDDKVQRMERELRRSADGKGLFLTAIFSELVCGAHDAFNDLLQELQRTDAHYVIVPTFRHLARSVMLQNCLLTRIEFDAHAEVFELVETTS